MAASASRVFGPEVPGAGFLTVTDITMDATYTSAGEAVTAADLGLQEVLFADCVVKVQSGAGNSVEAWYDITNKVIRLNAAAAAVGSVDLTTTATMVVRVLAYGRGRA